MRGNNECDLLCSGPKKYFGVYPYYLLCLSFGTVTSKFVVTVVTTDKQAGAELCQAHKGYIGDTEKDNYDRFNDHNRSHSLLPLIP